MAMEKGSAGALSIRTKTTGGTMADSLAWRTDRVLFGRITIREHPRSLQTLPLQQVEPAPGTIGAVWASTI